MWPEGDVMIGGAQYTSRLIRQPAGWRIAAMFLNVKWMHDPAGRLPPPGAHPDSESEQGLVDAQDGTRA
jgi:hypothetical protein